MYAYIYILIPYIHIYIYILSHISYIYIYIHTRSHIHIYIYIHIYHIYLKPPSPPVAGGNLRLLHFSASTWQARLGEWIDGSYLMTKIHSTKLYIVIFQSSNHLLLHYFKPCSLDKSTPSIRFMSRWQHRGRAPHSRFVIFSRHSKGVSSRSTVRITLPQSLTISSGHPSCPES